MTHAIIHRSICSSYGIMAIANYIDKTRPGINELAYWIVCLLIFVLTYATFDVLIYKFSHKTNKS
jgi:phosphotransferase system  glucose/maltose/N-acetylglucosamine-specific IIC component